MPNVHLRLQYLDENETRLFHMRLSTTSIRNGHQTTTVTTTSHWSREMAISLGPHGTLVTGMKQSPLL
jgi:hypothetical protein